MIKIENHIGSIRVTRNYLYGLIEHAVTGCFGVADLNDSSLFETIQTRLCPESIRRGICFKYKKNMLVVDLHIVTGIGANMSVIASSIRNKVRYAIEQAIGIEPAEVNVYIDGIHS